MLPAWDQLICLEAEITGYRKGSIRVEFRLRSGLLIWRETTRWTRNFIRSLDLSESRRLLAALEQARVMEWQPFYPDQARVEGEGSFRLLWGLRLVFADGSQRRCAGKDAQPPEYSALMDSVSEICRQCFLIMD